MSKSGTHHTRSAGGGSSGHKGTRAVKRRWVRVGKKHTAKRVGKTPRQVGRVNATGLQIPRSAAASRTPEELADEKIQARALSRAHSRRRPPLSDDFVRQGVVLASEHAAPERAPRLLLEPGLTYERIE